MSTAIKPNSAREVYFSASALKAGVDAAAGRINGVILMESDREALGHGLWIDAATLETALASLPASGRILAYLHHPSMEDSIVGNGLDRFEDSVGYLDAVRIEDGCLKADLIFWDAYKSDPESHYAKIMEMAATDASLINFSIEACGYAVFVTADGQDVSADIDDEDGDEGEGMAAAPAAYLRDIPSFRVTDLTGAALVSEGAATSTLFKTGAARVLFSKLSARPASKDTPHGGASEATKPAPSPEPAAQVDAATNDMSLLKSLSAKFAADPARLARAVAVASETASLSADEIETMLAREDEQAEHVRVVELAAQRETRIGELTAALSAKDTELAAKAAEIEQLKAAHASALEAAKAETAAARQGEAAAIAKFEQLKTSGADPVLLGVPGASAKQPDEFAAAMDKYNAIPVSDSAARSKFYAEHIAPLFSKR